MNKSKWIWRGVIGLAVLYGIYSGISSHVELNRLAHQLQFGTQAQKIQGATQLMKRDRLFDKMQQMSTQDRIKAMDTVEKIPGDLSITQCITLLKDTDPDVHARVTKALTVLAKDDINLLVPALKDSDVNVQTGAKDALVAIGPESIPVVLPSAKEIDLSAAVFDVLVRIGEPSIPALVGLMHADDQDIRMLAADSLSKVMGPDKKPSKLGTPALLEATKGTPAVRRVAISSLCTIGDPRATDLLVQVLSQTKDDGEVRARAARALSVIGGPRAISALTGAFNDWDSKVKTSVITGLQTMGGSVVQPVTAAMSSGSMEAREAGAAVLENVDASEASSALLSLAKDSDPVVRASAARGLGVQTSSMQSAALIAMLGDPDGRVGEAAEDSLVALGRRSGGTEIPILLSALSSSAGQVVKYRAADSLARIGKPSVGPLVAVLNAGGDAAGYAAYALGRIGDAQAKPALEKVVASKDPNLAWVAQRALARL